VQRKSSAKSVAHRGPGEISQWNRGGAGSEKAWKASTALPRAFDARKLAPRRLDASSRPTFLSSLPAPPPRHRERFATEPEGRFTSSRPTVARDSVSYFRGVERSSSPRASNCSSNQKRITSGRITSARQRNTRGAKSKSQI